MPIYPGFVPDNGVVYFVVDDEEGVTVEVVGVVAVDGVVVEADDNVVDDEEDVTVEVVDVVVVEVDDNVVVVAINKALQFFKQ